MVRQQKIAASTFDITLPARIAALISLVILAAGLKIFPTAQAQTLTVLHSFTDGRDGANPMAGLSTDARGSLYGTAAQGGSGYGTVFKLAPAGSGWVFTPLYAFAGGADGDDPVARVVFGPNQTLYGTTRHGGEGGCIGGGCGTVFNLQPPPSACVTVLCPWRETIVLRFDGNGGSYPLSEVTFDNSGNMFGTTQYGVPLQDGEGSCVPDCGLVYELTPSNGGWTESTPYGFKDGSFGQLGAYPQGGVTFDSAGNLFGTVAGGYYGNGEIYELTPPGDPYWAEQDVHDFNQGGAGPIANMILDPSGTFYGTAAGLYPGYGTQPGSVFSLVPNGAGWTFTTLHTFPTLGGGPAGQLLRDSAGNLYGTTVTGGVNPLGTCPADGCGTIFELSPSNGGWVYSELYDFTGSSDGAAPYSNLVMDANGNLSGTASAGGNSNCAAGCGVVFKFTP
jgi:uncharacterized repeat protein (TIGR03803 family)